MHNRVLTYEGKVIMIGMPSVQQLLQGVLTLPQPRVNLQHDTYKGRQSEQSDICGILVQQHEGEARQFTCDELVNPSDCRSQKRPEHLVCDASLLPAAPCDVHAFGVSIAGY